jgi:hypothetical protein
VDNAGVIKAAFDSGDEVISATNVADGNYHLIAVNVDSEALQLDLYVDGTLEDSSALDQEVSLTKAEWTLLNNEDKDQPLVGELDDVRVFDYVLTRAEILEMMHTRFLEPAYAFKEGLVLALSFDEGGNTVENFAADAMFADGAVLKGYHAGFGEIEDEWELPLSLEGADEKRVVSLGMNAHATHGVDPGLDWRYQGMLSSGNMPVFYSALLVDDWLSRDVRAKVNTDTWTLKVEVPAEMEMTLTWNKGRWPARELRLTGVDGNGEPLSEELNTGLNMSQKNAVALPVAQNQKSYEFTVTYKGSLQQNILQLNAGWNLVSFPLKVTPGFDDIFASVDDVIDDNIWEWDRASGQYEAVDTATSPQPMFAYWIFNMGDQPVNVLVEGEESATNTRPLGEGWNLIGIVAEDSDAAVLLPLKNASDDELPATIWAFDEEAKAYKRPVELMSKAGYWLYIEPAFDGFEPMLAPTP